MFGEPCCLQCTLVEHLEQQNCRDKCPQTQHVLDFQPNIFMDPVMDPERGWNINKLQIEALRFFFCDLRRDSKIGNPWVGESEMCMLIFFLVFDFVYCTIPCLCILRSQSDDC